MSLYILNMAAFRNMFESINVLDHWVFGYYLNDLVN